MMKRLDAFILGSRRSEKNPGEIGGRIWEKGGKGRVDEEERNAFIPRKLDGFLVRVKVRGGPQVRRADGRFGRRIEEVHLMLETVDASPICVEEGIMITLIKRIGRMVGKERTAVQRSFSHLLLVVPEQ